MMTSESANSLSNLEPSPSLSEVVTRVWPCSSSHFRKPSSFSVVPECHQVSKAHGRGKGRPQTKQLRNLLRMRPTLCIIKGSAWTVIRRHSWLPTYVI